jgi:hypothetical protein
LGFVIWVAPAAVTRGRKLGFGAKLARDRQKLASPFARCSGLKTE